MGRVLSDNERAAPGIAFTAASSCALKSLGARPRSFSFKILCGLDDLTDQLLFCGQQRLPLFELGTRLRMSADCRYLRLRVRLDLCHLFLSLCFCRRQDLGRFFFRRSLGFLGVGFGVVNDLGDDFL